MAEEDAAARQAALAEALERVGDRWALLLVSALMGGPRRFSELRRDLPGIASNVLTERLRRLEAAGLVRGERYSERPPRWEYHLQPGGHSLAGVVRQLEQWAAGEQPGPPHGRCGTPMEARWFCPTCDEAVAPSLAQEDDDQVVFA